MKFYIPALVISIALYLSSLLLPAITFAHHEPLSGLHVLAWGWWGVLSLNFAWFANPAYLVAVISLLSRRHRVALITSCSAFVLGLLAFFAKQWWFNEGSGTDIAGLGAAFYVWMLSLLVLGVGAVLAFRTRGASA
jgi:hypothetical protein